MNKSFWGFLLLLLLFKIFIKAKGTNTMQNIKAFCFSSPNFNKRAPKCAPGGVCSPGARRQRTPKISIYLKKQKLGCRGFGGGGVSLLGIRSVALFNRTLRDGRSC